MALLALGLTVGYVGAASAQNASNGHDVSPGHYVAGSDEEDTDFAPAYDDHGGGHESAADNQSIHESELRSGDHVDPNN